MNKVVWRKPRRSDEQGGLCVELAALPDGVGVRDSTDPAGPRLALSPQAFRDLLSTLKHP